MYFPNSHSRIGRTSDLPVATDGDEYEIGLSSRLTYFGLEECPKAP